MARPPSSTLSLAQRRVLDAVLKRERLQLPNFVSDLVAELALKAESSLGPTLQRMARLGVILLQGGGVQGRQRLVIATPKGRLLCGSPAEESHAEPFPPLGTGAATPAPMLPLLGTIPAGPLSEVIARQEASFEAVSVEGLLRHRAGDFLLRIRGDSMVGDGVFDGDLVLLRPGIEVQQGEIAAVIWSGSGAECEATLKRVFRKPPPGLPKGAFATGTEPVAEDASRDPQESVRDGDTGEQILLRASNPAYPDMWLPAYSVRIAGVFRGLIRQGTKSSGPAPTKGGAR